jgi:hypothetical protein
MKKGKALPCGPRFTYRGQMPSDERPPTGVAESLYPAIEDFILTATEADVAALFASLREGLAGLKGPRADYGKKVSLAVERTEELLRYLLQVREKIESGQLSQGAPRT